MDNLLSYDIYSRWLSYIDLVHQSTNENRLMQDFTNSSSTESFISVGMDVHKKTIALCVYNASTAEILDERELLHDLPRVLK